MLLIHEFGFPCALPDYVRDKDKGLTVIEDCAYAIGTRVNGGAIGHIGDYAIYSLTKYYPIPFGELLVSRNNAEIPPVDDSLGENAKRIVMKCLSTAESKYIKWNQMRRSNWRYFSDQLNNYGLYEYFELGKTIVPGVFVVKIPPSFDGATIKENCVKAGIESTEYYGKNGFYFPVHQFLSDFDREYICYHFVQGLGD